MKHILRRIYTAEFNLVAIKLVSEQGLTLAEAGRKLDVATKSLRTWMDQLRSGVLYGREDIYRSEDHRIVWLGK